MPSTALDGGSRKGFIKATVDYALEDDGLRNDLVSHLKTEGVV